MSDTKFKGNFENKSEIIRKVFQEYPAATNQQLRKAIIQGYGIDVSSQLIIAAIGKHKTRIARANPSHLLDLAAKYLQEFGNDLGWAFYWLKRAA